MIRESNKNTLQTKKKGKLNARTKTEKVLYGIMFVLLSIHVASWIVPWIWVIISSLKGSYEYMVSDSFALPEKWLFSNYISAFKNLTVGDTSFAGMIFNSVWYVLLNSSLDMFVPACTGYVMAKYSFKGRNLIYSVAITCMTIPIYGGLASSMKLYMDLGAYDTPMYVVLSSMGGFGSSFLMYYGYFKNLPWSYAEAAVVDGGGPFTIFFKIMLPMAIPMMSVFAITGAMGSWNDYMSFVTWMPSWPNLATGLYEYQKKMERFANWPEYYAGALMSLIVPIAIFCKFQDKIMTSMTFGGLKG